MGVAPKDLIYVGPCSKGVLRDPDLLTLLVMIMKEISILMASVCRVFTMPGIVIRASLPFSVCVLMC